MVGFFLTYFFVVFIVLYPLLDSSVVLLNG